MNTKHWVNHGKGLAFLFTFLYFFLNGTNAQQTDPWLTEIAETDWKNDSVGRKRARLRIISKGLLRDSQLMEKSEAFVKQSLGEPNLVCDRKKKVFRYIYILDCIWCDNQKYSLNCKNYHNTTYYMVMIDKKTRKVISAFKGIKGCG